jgi:hypothetical protein
MKKLYSLRKIIKEKPKAEKERVGEGLRDGLVKWAVRTDGLKNERS